MLRRLRLAEPRPTFPVRSIGPVTADPSAPADSRIGIVDMLLLILFMIGIYTHYTLQVSAKIPFPSAPSGVAGMFLLWRRRNDIVPAHLAALLFVVSLYVGSILSANDLSHVGKRFTGLVQITYSLVIGYALFLTIVRANRNQIAHLFLGFCVVILIGCLLEDYAGLRPISDAVRHAIYKAVDVYDADLRDQVLYGRIRPKLFTSEPSAVTFAFTLFSFSWLMVTRTRWAPLKYLVLMTLGIFVMPGPTLLLMIPLLVPYQLLRARSWSPGFVRMALLAVFAIITVAVFYVLGTDARYRRRQRRQLLLPRRRPGAGRPQRDRAASVRRRRPHRRAVHRQRGGERLHAFGGVLVGVEYLGYLQRADQLFLAALDLSRPSVGNRGPRRPQPLAQDPGRAQRAVFLDGVGGAWPGLGRLCRAHDVDRPAAERRVRRACRPRLGARRAGAGFPLSASVPAVEVAAPAAGAAAERSLTWN